MSKICTHIKHCKISYESIDIQLYDNANITMPTCTIDECSNQDNVLICITCGQVICNDHLKQHVDNDTHFILKPFNDNKDSFWCNQCNDYMNQSESCMDDEGIKNKFKDIENLFTAMKLFIYFDGCGSGKHCEIIDNQIKEIINNGGKLIQDDEINENGDNISKFVQLLLNGTCKNVIVLTGAGISVASGMPDFRSIETGLYNNENVAKFKLPFKEAVFDIDYFKFNPEPFYILSKDLYPGKFKTTPVHHFIKLLSDKGILLRNYAQNADTLERIAGIPLDKLIEAHGSFANSYCMNCKKHYSQDYIKQILYNTNEEGVSIVPRCNEPQCNNAVIKPDIVFFGESLPPLFNQCLIDDINKCDGLIVIGTSLKVEPIASMVKFFSNRIPRLLINNQIVGNDIFGGFQFSGTNTNNLDFKLIGDCQEGVIQLSKLLNWDI